MRISRFVTIIDTATPRMLPCDNRLRLIAFGRTKAKNMRTTMNNSENERSFATVLAGRRKPLASRSHSWLMTPKPPIITISPYRRHIIFRLINKLSFNTNGHFYFVERKPVPAQSSAHRSSKQICPTVETFLSSKRRKLFRR